MRNWLIIGTMLAAGTAQAGVIEVAITGIPDDRGQVLCSLHAQPEGFPERAAVSDAVAVPRAGQAMCRFDGVAPGTYAVAVLHDGNANGRLDVNALGYPVESWGISAGPAPRFRAPRFDEASFRMGDRPMRLNVRLRR